MRIPHPTGLLALACVLAPVYAAAQTPAATAGGSALTVSRIEWLAGEWHGTLSNGMHAQMQCSHPEQGSVVCWFRLTSAAETVMYELISLLDTPAGMEMRFRHFTPALASLFGNDATVLRLASPSADTLRFENPTGTQPKRSILTRTGPDSYLSHSDLIASDGTTSVIEVAYQRVSNGATP
jgi:hypothetical protein